MDFEKDEYTPMIDTSKPKKGLLRGANDTQYFTNIDGIYVKDKAAREDMEELAEYVRTLIPTVPDGYTKIDYVECPSTSEPCGFTLDYTIYAYDIHEVVIEPTYLNGEIGFAGISDAYELYIDNDTIGIWSQTSGWLIALQSAQSVEIGNTYKLKAIHTRDYNSNSWSIGYYSLTKYIYKGRIHGYKIYRPWGTDTEVTLIHDLVPVIRNSDNKVGMYDMVENVFYSSATGTEFVAPSEE